MKTHKESNGDKNKHKEKQIIKTGGKINAIDTTIGT
jgi:hypothetical protein